MNPTLARSAVIAMAPRRSDGEWRSSDSCSPTAVAATTSGARRRADAKAQTEEHRSVEQCGTRTQRLEQDRGGDDGAAAEQARDEPEFRVRLDQFRPRFARSTVRARTSRSRTSSGAPSEANTSGNSAIPSMYRAISRSSTTRVTATIWITRRRPPATRSIIGPISGATNRNGAKLTARKSRTWVRAASRSTLKKKRVGERHDPSPHRHPSSARA